MGRMAAKFTQSAQETLHQAQAEAIRREHQELIPEHLLSALIRSGSGEEGGEGSIVPDLLQVAGVNLAALKSALERTLAAIPKVSGGGGQIYASTAFNRILVLAEDEARRLGDEFVS